MPPQYLPQLKQELSFNWGTLKYHILTGTNLITLITLLPSVLYGLTDFIIRAITLTTLQRDGVPVGYSKNTFS